MSMKERPHDGVNMECSACGAKTVDYPQPMMHPLVIGLMKLERSGGGPINLDQLGMTHSQRDNFQKLQYWGLVRKSYREDGSRMGGCWEITGRGRAWLMGTIGIPKVAVTYRGELEYTEGPEIGPEDVVADWYLQREEWAAIARPHEESSDD